MLKKPTNWQFTKQRRGFLRLSDAATHYVLWVSGTFTLVDRSIPEGPTGYTHMPKHALVIYNPAAKSQVQTEVWIGKLVEKLNEQDEFLVSFYPTTAETGPEHLVPLFKPPLDLIIAAGGDGTVRFALAALAKAKSKIPCAIFPLGTGNVLARNLGIVKESILANPLEHAFDYLAHGRPVEIDMAMMNGEYFAGMAGVGPISDAFMRPARELKTRFRLLAYISAMIQTVAMPPRIFRITTGGMSFKVQASGIFLANVEDLGIGKTNELSNLNDGFLELHIVDPINFGDYVNLGFRFVAGSVDEKAPECILRCKEAVIETLPRRGVRSEFQRLAKQVRNFLAGKKIPDPARVSEAPLMIDGEECGTTPMRVTIVPKAVTVLVPPTRAEVQRTEDPLRKGMPGLLESMEVTHQLNYDDYGLRDVG
jgi:diacylglycerol kinase family enzyme